MRFALLVMFNVPEGIEIQTDGKHSFGTNPRVVVWYMEEGYESSKR
jgi:hypothetical protein